MNENKALIDTNILVYAWDAGDPAKHRLAIDAIDRYRHGAFLSIQNVSEFSTVMLRNGCDPGWVADIASLFERLMTVLPLSVHDIRQATRAVKQYPMSYWEAQIWSVAKSNGIPVIVSEDGPSGNSYEGVAFVNPFNGE